MRTDNGFDRNLTQGNSGGVGWRRLFLWAAWLPLVILGAAHPAAAQEEDNLPSRLASNRILPEETMLYFRVRSMPELIDMYAESGFGKMMQDDRIAPMLDDLYNELRDEYDAQVREELDDLELEQFRDLFAGELCFALVAKRRQPMEGILIVDVQPDTDTVDRLFDVAKRRAEEEGRPIEIDSEEDDVDIHILRTDAGRSVYYFRQQDTLYFATNRDLAAEMIANLRGTPLENTRQFVDNRKYRTIMGQCRVDRDNPPIMTFFVDPIELFKAATRGETFAAVAVGFFPLLGIDGLLGIGGAVLPGDGDFVALSHLHILMSSPREGLLRAVSFRSGSFALPICIPEDTAALLMSSLDVPRLYSGIETVVDLINGEGTLAELMERANEEVELDLKEDLIDLLTGTLTFVQWADPESSALNGASNGYMIEVNDEEKALETVEKLMARIERDANEEVFSLNRQDGHEYWVVEAARRGMENSRDFRRDRADRADPADRDRINRQFEFEDKFTRQPVPAFAFFDNQFVITDSEELMKHLVATYQGRGPGLGESEHYSEVRRKAENLLDGRQPAGLMYNRPINQLASVWNAIASEDLWEMAQEGLEDEPFFARLAEAMSRNRLPPIEEMEEYFSTSGAIMTDDSTGLHFLFFELHPGGR